MKFWYLIIFIALEGLIFIFYNFVLHSVELFKGDYILSFLATIPVIITIGIVLYNYLVEPKKRQDIVLENLIRETLHEINLPISTIDANVSMLSKSLKDSKNLKKLNRIDAALHRLNRLYEQLRYEIKKDIMPIEKVKIDLRELILERVSYFKQLNRNNFNLELDSLYILVDNIGLEQVLDNIIENSMKYSNRNSDINITLKGSELIIEDYGVGISEDELSLIYQRYYRESDLFEGEGIGLKIVKTFCDKEDILLKIESKKGIGTKVILNFKSLVLSS